MNYENINNEGLTSAFVFAFNCVSLVNYGCIKSAIQDTWIR